MVPSYLRLSAWPFLLTTELELFCWCWVSVFLFHELFFQLRFNGQTHVYLFTNPSIWAEWVKVNFLKWKLTGLNSEFPFYKTSCHTKVKEPNVSYLPKGKPIFRPFVGGGLKHAFLFTVNFMWFALLSHQKFDDRPLFKPGALWFAAILNSIKTFLCGWNNCCYKLIPNNSGFTFMKNILEKKKKNFFAFLKNSPLFIEWPLYIGHNTSLPIHQIYKNSDNSRFTSLSTSKSKC